MGFLESLTAISNTSKCEINLSDVRVGFMIHSQTSSSLFSSEVGVRVDGQRRYHDASLHIFFSTTGTTTGAEDEKGGNA